MTWSRHARRIDPIAPRAEDSGAISDVPKIDSFGWALGGALMMSVLGSVGEWLLLCRPA